MTEFRGCPLLGYEGIKDINRSVVGRLEAGFVGVIRTEDYSKVIFGIIFFSLNDVKNVSKLIQN